MAWTDLLGKSKKDPKSNGQSQETAASLPAHPGAFDPSALNFPGLMQTPAAPARVADIPVAGEPFAELPDPGVVAEAAPSIQDPKVVAEAKTLAEAARGAASAVYKSFNSAHERMLKANNGTPVPLNLVCAAAGVNGKQLIAEIASFERSLQIAVTDRYAEIDTEEAQAIHQLETETEELRQDLDARNARIAELTEELQRIRSEASQLQQQASGKSSEINGKKTAFTLDRQRVRSAAKQVATELAQEKRTFSNC